MNVKKVLIGAGIVGTIIGLGTCNAIKGTKDATTTPVEDTSGVKSALDDTANINMTSVKNELKGAQFLAELNKVSHNIRL